MIVDEKLALYDRLEVVRDIVVNIKDDMKLMAQRVPEEHQEYHFVAMRAAETALAVNKLMSDILQVEQKLQEFQDKKED